MASVLASIAKHAFVVDGGEVGRLVRSRDWSATPLGPIEGWPPTLKTAVNIMLTSPGPVSILWGPERVQIYNDAYIPIAAERHPDALGQPVAQNWSDAYEAFLAPILDRVFDGETVRIDEYAVPLRTPSGRVEQRFFTGSFQPLHDETGTVEGVFHPLSEVTGNKAAAEDQRRAEQALRESETRYRQIVEGAEDYAIVRLDDRGIITTWNTGAERLTGFTERDAIGQPGDILFTPEDRALGRTEAELNRARSEGRALNERWHMRKDGSRFWASGLMMRLDADGGSYLNMFRDRTAEHEAEAALAAEVAALGRLQEVSTRLVGDEAPQALYDAILTAAADLMGSECASIQMLDAAGDLKLLAHRGYDPRSAAYWQTVDARSESTCGLAMTTGERVIVPDVEDSGLAHRSGDLQSYRWTGMRAIQTTPLLSRSGKPIGMISTHWKQPYTPPERDLKLFDVLARQAADAIERTTAQANLRESEARQAFLLSLSDAMRSLKTPADIASLAAERLAERFNLSRVFYAEFFGSLMRVERDYTRGVGSLVGEHDLAAFGPDLLRAYHDSPIVKVDDVRTDLRFSEDARSGLLARQVGAYLDVVLFEHERWVSVLALQSAKPRTWTSSEEGLFREVGERVKAAIERARAEDRLRELNDTLERRVAEALAERNMLAKLVEMTDVMIMAIDLDYNILAINAANADEFERIYGVRPKAGDNILALLADQPEHQEQVRIGWAQGMRGEPVTFVEDYGDPTRVRPYYEVNFRPLRDESGELVGFYQFVTDVTDRLRREAQLAEAHDALRQSQKMEAMGQLTGGVAHDFNNLLTPIIGSLDMLQRKQLGNEREQRLIAGAMQSAERAKTLVQRLLAFARRQPLQPVPVDVAKLVTGMGELVASTTGPQIKIVVEAPDGLPPAKADPNQLEMALLNLAVNARDAMMEGGGTLRISTRVEDVRAGHRTKLRPGPYLCLSVADTGTGMDEATIARAVEPFFSTKGVGKGTGLGLSMVHGLASQLGGALVIQSRPGLGTNIELWLPQSTAGQEAVRPAAGTSELPATRGTALLVDDEEVVRISTADMLTDLGYAVVEATSAEEALRLVNTGEHFDLLVTDHLMPGMSGTDLARAIRTAKPGMPVLLVSGYAEREGVDPDLARLNKPFRKDELASSLAQLMTEH
ncbi:PAS domain S-box-containing protein [Methylorubrum extorquens]|uniref:PAS domain S-box protein n=1 Tax=Methylorubrum extorquens TaxID=408 RepID=UPI0020A0818D|nr:PAS domain S-box protein [Methylorubrum extorquens]MCP1561047.1 PAS domain S-box-containing protein [Methylorubrum extorquens]MDF9789525.1 PAS domain S-box-containing protein [Methylorubrum extorquens]MDF9861240.1 PAS domain S-box-containing protein [Methylorubrum pseudosasae]MDH6664043.1 PAS domain S-box-containing protein [Methylorubrum zatmanii]